MELRAGYKNTEVGVIPEDWEVKELGEICYTSKSRINPITSRLSYKCIELEHLSQGSGTLLGYVDSKNLLSQKSIFTKGDVLFGKLRPYLRKFLFAEFEGVCTTEIWVLQVTSNTSNRFLYQLIQSDKIIEAANLSTGTKMPRAEWKTVSGTKIPVPSKAEQTAIATALSDADALISSLEKLIEKKRNVKQGAMQKLLKPKEGWELKRLGEIAFFRRGSFPQPYGLDKWYDDISGYPFIQVFDVDDNKKLKPDTKRHISKEAQAYSVFVKKGSIVLTIQGSIGRIAITQYDAFVDRTLLLFEEFKVEMDTYFFMLLIHTLFDKEKELAPGGIIKTITKAVLSNFKISYPNSKAEQIKIASVFIDMDSEITALETRLEKYKNIKLGMMQNLLTGKIRLVE